MTATEPPSYNGDVRPPVARPVQRPAANTEDPPPPTLSLTERFVRSGGRVFQSGNSKRWVARHKGKQTIGDTAEEAINKILGH